ncbi:hypothetical protein ADUPG1_000850, partial [Aduncisulcus paluster]
MQSLSQNFSDLLDTLGFSDFVGSSDSIIDSPSPSKRRALPTKISTQSPSKPKKSNHSKPDSSFETHLEFPSALDDDPMGYVDSILSTTHDTLTKEPQKSHKNPESVDHSPILSPVISGGSNTSFPSLTESQSEKSEEHESKEHNNPNSDSFSVTQLLESDSPLELLDSFLEGSKKNHSDEYSHKKQQQIDLKYISNPPISRKEEVKATPSFTPPTRNSLTSIPKHFSPSPSPIPLAPVGILSPDVATIKIVPPSLAVSPEFLSLFPFPKFNPLQSFLLPCLLNSNDSVVVSAPTGSGKTVV